jgi:spore maturation protein CgeB
LYEFLLNPVAALGLRATTSGVRYPEHALASLKAAGIAYGNWCPNHASPAVFSRYRVTVHVPRRPYTRALPGIPTIRMFEALACGIPLISAPWHDSEHLFDAGRDYLVARNGTEMVAQLRAVLGDPVFAKQVADHGRRTILSRHTCSHRVDELLSIVGRITGARTQPREVRTCLPA